MTLEEILLNKPTNGTTSQPNYGDAEEDSMLSRITEKGLSLQRGEETSDIHQRVISAARERNLSEPHALAMFKQESNFDPYIGNGGLGQFTRDTAKDRKLDYQRLNTDSQYNIESSLDYLKELQDRNKGNIEAALTQYNGGGDPNYLENVQRHLPEMQKIVAANPRKPGFFERQAAREQQSLEAQRRGAIGAGEAVLGTATGMAAFGLGITQVPKDIFAEIAKEFETGAQSPNFWTSTRDHFKETIQKYGYSPRTEEGQRLLGVIAAVPQAIGWLADKGKQSLVNLGASENAADGAALAIELLGYKAIGPATALALAPIRGTIAKYRSLYNKASSDAALATPEAIKLSDAIAKRMQSSPEAMAELQAAREHLTSTLRGISEQGPQDLANVLRGISEKGPRGLTAVLQQRRQQAPLGELPFPERAQGELPLKTAPRQEFPEPVIPTREGAQQELPLYSEGLFAPRNKTLAEQAVMTPDEYLSATGRVPRDVNFRDFIANEFLPMVQRAFEQGVKPQNVHDPALRAQYVENLRGALAASRAEPVARPPTEPAERLPAPATFIGTQPGVPGVVPDVDLYNLTKDIPGHPKDSTVAGQTLEEAGFKLPTAPEAPVDTTPAIPKPSRAGIAPKVIETTPREAIAEPAALAPRQTRYASASVSTVDSILESRGPLATAVAEPQNVPLQIRYSDNSPSAILYNDSGLGSRTSIDQIRRDTARGRISPDVAQSMEANLRRQADLFGVPIEEAHGYTGVELVTKAMQLARDNNLELYRAKRIPTGVEYEQVPRDVIDVTLRLQSSTLAEPAVLTKEDAATYVADKTKPVGAATVDEITRALETNTDISDRLPEEARQPFKDMLELQRKGMDESETRRYVDIFSDILDLIAPPDIPPTQLGTFAFYGLTPARRAAALRLYADAQKAGVSFTRFLDETNLPEAEKALFIRYLAGVNKPPLPQGIDPRDMQLTTASGDRIVGQRVGKVNGKVVRHPPIYESEVNAIQQARELREIKGLTTLFGRDLGEHNLLVTHHALRRMGLLDPIAYAYRASDRAFSRERAAVYKDLDAMAAVHDKASRERIGEYGYSNTLQGINILIKNERDIPTLTKNEQITRAAQQRFFEETLFRINEVREAIGRELIEPIDNYIPFLRVFTASEKMKMGFNLITDSAKSIRDMQEGLGDMQYPRERKRTGATYTAEFDSFKLLKDYADSALRQIHLAPFVEKMRELTQYPLPEPIAGGRINPRTGKPITNVGKPTWLLSEHKPGTYEYLTNLINFVERGVQPTFSPGIDRAANALMSNLAGGLISLSLRSGLVHLSRLRGTFHRTGYLNTFQAIADTMADSMRYFFSPEGTKWARNLAESKVLDSRGLIDSYDDVSAAVMGGRPRDFIQALKSGEYRTALRHFDNKVGFAWMRAVDNTIAQVAYNAARDLGERAGLKGESLYNFSDDHVVLTEGGTMPWDVAPIQYTTGGKMITQFHRWTINNWNYFIEDVLGATGRRDVARLLKRDPDRYAPAVVKSIASFIIATTAMTVFFEDVLHTRTPIQAPIRDVKQGIDAGDSKLALAGKLAGSLLAETPIIGPTAHGFGVGGAVLGTLTEVGKQLFDVPGAYKSFKQGDTLPQAAMRLYGSPAMALLGGRGSRQVGQIVKGMDRNDPLSSFYQRPPSERAEQRGRGRLNTRIR